MIEDHMKDIIGDWRKAVKHRNEQPQRYRLPNQISVRSLIQAFSIDVMLWFKSTHYTILIYFVFQILYLVQNVHVCMTNMI